MNNFRTSFFEFHKVRLKDCLTFPNSKALFEEEVLMLFDKFRIFLVNRFMSHKGLNLKGFKSLLVNKGYVFVTKRK